MSNENLVRLAELAKEVPGQPGKNAQALVQRMGEMIEGLGDKPIPWRAPTLKLVQSTSDRSKLPKGATIGSMVLGETVVASPLRTIPIRLYTTRQMWNPDSDKATMVCSSPDGDTGFKYGSCKACPNAKFDEIEKRSACNKTITVVSVAEDFSNVFFTNFSKTNYSNGLDWQGLMKKAGVSPFKRIYEISSGTSPKAKNVEILKVEPVSGDNNVGDKLLPFVEELFRVVGEDRKSSLEGFYKYLETRASGDTAPGLVDHSHAAGDVDGEVVLISAEPAAGDTAAAAGAGYTL